MYCEHCGFLRGFFDWYPEGSLCMCANEKDGE